MCDLPECLGRLSDGIQSQQVEGEPDLDSKDHYLRKPEDLRISLGKVGCADSLSE